MRTFQALGLLGLLVLLMVCATPCSACYFCSLGGSCYQCLNEPEVDGGTSCTVSCESCTVSGLCYSEVGGGGCFLAGTLLATPLGAVAIETIKVGDLLLSQDETGQPRIGAVTDTHKTETHAYLVLNGTLQVTATHPFFVDGEWIEAGDLKVGDILTNRDGSQVSIASIARVNKGVRVYNVTVDDAHTFFANNILVHNKPPKPGS